MRAARPVSCWQWKSCCGANRASRSAHRLIREVRPVRRPIRPWLRVPRRRRPAAARPKGGILLPVLIGIGLAVAVIVLIDAALRPTVTELAKAKVKNAVTSIINDAVNETLSSEAISYGDLVTLEKDTAGQVTVLAANTAQLNALRTEILGRILEQVEQLDSQELGIPLGNLTGFATAIEGASQILCKLQTAVKIEQDLKRRQRLVRCRLAYNNNAGADGCQGWQPCCLQPSLDVRLRRCYPGIRSAKNTASWA